MKHVLFVLGIATAAWGLSYEGLTSFDGLTIVGLVLAVAGYVVGVVLGSRRAALEGRRALARQEQALLNTRAEVSALRAQLADRVPSDEAPKDV